MYMTNEISNLFHSVFGVGGKEKGIADVVKNAKNDLRSKFLSPKFYLMKKIL